MNNSARLGEAQYAHGDEQEISLMDLAKFVKEFYKKILFFGLLGVSVGVISCMLWGDYTATVILSNYSGVDIPRLKYLQAFLPRVEQERQKTNKNAEDEFLSSEKFWTKSVKPNLLLSKSDGKDLLDPASLSSSGAVMPTIQIIVKAPTAEDAVKRVEKAGKFFAEGSALLQLRDLVRNYELGVISTDSNSKKKIASADIELEYIQKRIRNLNELKNQYPSSVSLGGQVVDAKDSGAKYLPLTTQIIAATTDANNVKESLSRYRDEESQNSVRKLFVEKAKPLVETSEDGSSLVNKLLVISGEIEKNVTGDIQLLAIEEIKVALIQIETNRIYGLKQSGVTDVVKPAYLSFIGIGLFGGLFLGLLLAIGIKIAAKVFPRASIFEK